LVALASKSKIIIYFTVLMQGSYGITDVNYGNLYRKYRVTQKNWNFWKTQQKLKKSKKKNLLTVI